MGRKALQEIAEQTLHFLLGTALPAVGALREWLQWPPGEERNGYCPSDRVEDAYRDFTFYLLGAQVTIIVLAALLIWRW